MVISTLKVSQFLGFTLWKKGCAEREWRWSVRAAGKKKERDAHPPLGEICIIFEALKYSFSGRRP
jgi:hypothetical protein